MAQVLQYPGSTPPAQAGVVRYGLPKRIAISAFIVFHIAATLLWIAPNSSIKQELLPKVRNYISYVGLWQAWGMFAPNPSNLNMTLGATVTYQDGSTAEWKFPRMHELPLVERYGRERYRKYQEYAYQDSFAPIWPSLVRYIADQMNTDPNNPPAQVVLNRNWWFVPKPPASGDISTDPPHTWNRYEFFKMTITPLDLQR